MSPPPTPVTIALDAMGADKGPAAAVEAAAALSLDARNVRVLLVGDEAVLGDLLASHSHDSGYVGIVHTSEHIQQDQKPGPALAALPEASILVATRLVAEGRAQAVVSAGNTGACILAGSRVLRRIEGVRRAALAAVYPTEQRHGPKEDPFALLLDVGCTLGASPRDLATFAAMGAAYSRAISNTERPSVALLSNGAEAQKGPPEIVAAHPLIASLPGLTFTGNIEGLDIPRGSVDVVVTNGFLGNVVLKMLEGMYEMALRVARESRNASVTRRLGLRVFDSSLRSLRKLFDWEEYGGAPILGLEKVFIKAHGRSSARALGNACRVAAKAVRADVPGLIRLGVADLPAEEDR